MKRLTSLRPDQFELYFEHGTSTRIEAKNQEVETFSRSEDVGLSVRVVKNRKLGFSFTTSLEKDAVTQAVDRAFEMAQLMPEDEFVNLPSLAGATYPEIRHFDERGLKIAAESKIALAKELEAVCRSADKRITGVRSSSFSESSGEIHLVDSSGQHIRHRNTMYSASITCKAEQAGDSQMGGDFGFSVELEKLDIRSVGKQAARWATELLGAGAAPTMVCPAVFRNSVMADLVEFLSESFSAEAIDKGRSMLAGKIGQKLFSDGFSLIDDGLLPGGYGTGPFDGEGTPAGRTVLVDKGTVAGTLYDRYYARKAGARPTGSASRGIKSPPSIGHTNLFLQPGTKTPEQLLDGITKGILITDLMGVHTANSVTGDFSLGASGILIENGKLTRPVRGFAVAGNVLEVFRKIVDTGSDLRFFGGMGAPSALISEISVGGT